jgi:hypothetical protein
MVGHEGLEPSKRMHSVYSAVVVPAIAYPVTLLVGASEDSLYFRLPAQRLLLVRTERIKLSL